MSMNTNEYLVYYQEVAMNENGKKGIEDSYLSLTEHIHCSKYGIKTEITL